MIFTFLLLLSTAWADVTGTDLLTGQKTDVPPGSKGTVIVFLSAKCPCSNSHIDILKNLSKSYPDFAFVGVNANADESEAMAKTYFKNAALPFPVLRDSGFKLADQFKALKTPHVFLLSPDGKIVYKGGVTNSAHGPKADENYLKDALNDVHNGRPVKVANSRTLGCIISRGESHVW